MKELVISVAKSIPRGSSTLSLDTSNCAGFKSTFSYCGINSLGCLSFSANMLLGLDLTSFRNESSSGTLTCSIVFQSGEAAMISFKSFRMFLSGVRLVSASVRIPPGGETGTNSAASGFKGEFIAWLFNSALSSGLITKSVGLSETATPD